MIGRLRLTAWARSSGRNRGGPRTRRIDLRGGGGVPLGHVRVHRGRPRRRRCRDGRGARIQARRHPRGPEPRRRFRPISSTCTSWAATPAGSSPRSATGFAGPPRVAAGSSASRSGRAGPTAETVEATRHEALINLAFAGADVHILCPYDASRLDPAVIGDAERTHPQLIREGHRGSSACYVEPLELWASEEWPLPEPVGTVLALDVDGDLAALRVTDRGLGAGRRRPGRPNRRPRARGRRGGDELAHARMSAGVAAGVAGR